MYYYYDADDPNEFKEMLIAQFDEFKKLIFKEPAKALRTLDKFEQWISRKIHNQFIDYDIVALSFEQIKELVIYAPLQWDENTIIQLCTKLLQNLNQLMINSAKILDQEIFTRLMTCLAMLPYINWGEQLALIPQLFFKSGNINTFSLDTQCKIFAALTLLPPINFAQQSVSFGIFVDYLSLALHTNSARFVEWRRLWQLVQVSRISFSDERLTHLLPQIDIQLELLPPPMLTISLLHQQVFDRISGMFKLPCRYKLINEWRVGCYYLDIVILELKINIEVDGPHHYANRALRSCDKVRDEILRRLGWRVVRIAYYAWPDDERAQKIYLKTILDPIIKDAAQ
jgi:hypothetical protein